MAESLHILLGTSACLQWLCHSGERTVARGPLVFCWYQSQRWCESWCPFLSAQCLVTGWWLDAYHICLDI